MLYAQGLGPEGLDLCGLRARALRAQWPYSPWAREHWPSIFALALRANGLL